MIAGNHYITSTEPLDGEIKRRYIDFVVEEIHEDYECKACHFFDNTPEEKWKKIDWNVPGKGEYLIVEMEKLNLDVPSAVKRVARFMMTGRKRIGFAGMKDKRGITSQLISIWKPDIERLKLFKSRMIRLTPIKWSDKRMDLGHLKGNRFRITIRSIEKNPEETKTILANALKEMKNGIPNYFGMQRFGGIRKVSHLVGRKMIDGKVDEAVMLYLTHTSEREDEDLRNARNELKETGNFSEASKKFPTKFSYERAIIHHLCKYPKDFVNAFKNLPKTIVFIFTHAYQSYLFNRYIDKRFERGIGLNETEGDVVENGFVMGPLFGFETELSKGVPREIEQEILKEENLELNNFKVNSFPEVSSKGGRKAIKMMIFDQKIGEIAEDEFNEGKNKAVIEFRLDKGNYATTVLREIIKKEIN